jgi:hypothetical protein
MILDFVSFGADGWFIRSKIGFLFLFPIVICIGKPGLLYVSKNCHSQSEKRENNYLSANSKKVI